MESLWGNIIQYEEEKKPESILAEQFVELNRITDGMVIGRVERFDKTIDELSASPFNSTIESMHDVFSPNAQGYLGETKDVSVLTFEAFITAKAIPNYKYRFMFLQHGLAPFPVSVVLERTICEEIQQDEESFICNNEDEFKEMLKDVLSSERVMSIVSRLMTYK